MIRRTTLPETAYVLLWFPKPSETFIFTEVMQLTDMGLPVKTFTLYGQWDRHLSSRMRIFAEEPERLGIAYLRQIPKEILFWWRRDRGTVIRVTNATFKRSWYGAEKTAENLWAYFCGFRLARLFTQMGIEHIHAPWAGGPATAAWIASHLTGIPFSFSARAWDIYPPDGLLVDKIRDSAFVRAETGYNVEYLASCAEAHRDKIHLTYNGAPLKARRPALVSMRPPYQLLAVGRFVGKKGFTYLLKACRELKDAGLPFHLTLAGDGPEKYRLRLKTSMLGLDQHISFPGFVPYDRVPHLFESADVFVMPSIIHSSGDRDGIPHVIMEALLHRVPVVATEVSGIPEVIEHGVTGILVPQRNPSALARSIGGLIRNRQYALALAENGRQRVLEMFDPVRNYRSVLALYEQHIPRKRSRIGHWTGRQSIGAFSRHRKP
ncbi:glycosyltransferase family 4 protein [Thermodesulfobacteriota bacterium]